MDIEPLKRSRSLQVGNGVLTFVDVILSNTLSDTDRYLYVWNVSIDVVEAVLL